MADSEVQVASARRSHRVQVAISVIVSGADFRETTSTVSVNAHGGLVMLKATVLRGGLLGLINPKTGEEMLVKVTSLGKPEDGKIPIGVEFSEPSPLFWRINFPPEDWLTSEERKRPNSNTPTK